MINNQQLEEDLDYIANYVCEKFTIDDTTVLITGATGLIGVNLVKSLLYMNNLKSTNVKIIAMVRSIDKAKAIYEQMFYDDNLKFVVHDIIKPIDIKENIDYIFHCASVTASKDMITHPIMTINVSIEGTRNILELSKCKKVKSIVYLSSMEMYGKFNSLSKNVTENDLGYINPLDVRSNYPESKRLCENMCIAYLSEHNLPVKIARLSQTFGPGILENENRVFAQFARSVLLKKDIVLHTTGESEGNYTYLRDAITGLFTILLKGQNGEAYNISNEETHMSIKDMAMMVVNEIANNDIDVVFDIPKENVFGYAQPTKIKVISQKLRDLGWQPSINLKEAYCRLIESMK